MGREKGLILNKIEIDVTILNNKTLIYFNSKRDYNPSHSTKIAIMITEVLVNKSHLII